MKSIISITVFTLFLLNAVSQQQDFTQLKADAETAYSQKSYAKANEIYARIDKSQLTTADARWVEFRLADTSWRSEAATQTSDTTKFEQAMKQLEQLLRDYDKPETQDLVWAESQESLGDFFWTRRNQMNWGMAWPHYQQALEWWAGQRDLDRARERYLKIVFTAAQPPNADQYYFYTYYGNYVPLNILENALKISTKGNDKSRLHYLLAMTMRYSSSDLEIRERIPDEFEEALKPGKSVDWYDDALFYYAEWMNSNGSLRQLENGQWQQEPDYVKTVVLLRRLTTEFTKGETRFFDQAQEMIRNITSPTIGVAVSNIFLPDSELQFNLNARNVSRIQFSLYKIDLINDVRFSKSTDEDEGEVEDGTWLQKLPLGGRAAVKTWTKDLPETDQHKPFNQRSRIDGKLPMGAYLLEARSGQITARDLVLVSDVSIVIKSSATQALVYFANALSGAPVVGARVSLWESYYTPGNRWHWRRLRQTTNSDGLTVFPLSNSSSTRNLFVSAATNEHQSFASANSYGRNVASDSWRIYAFTDRPAYRPKESVQWKFIARRMVQGTYSTPANQTIEYQITDPRGTKVTDGKAELNAFGSAWGSLELTEQLPLGEYNIQFWDASRNSIGSARLFRLEEYKLPEFRVQIRTPEQDGKKKAFRLGENVEVNIQADYYFGGPVSNATVEIVVYQNPFYHHWRPRRDYYWYYDDEQQFGRYYGGSGQVIKRETIRTDATGKATLTFESPRQNYNQDFEYRIEARVTDSSRREIVASDTVRVTRYRYYVYPRPERNIYRPKDRVTVDIKALDANDQPVKTQGNIKVTRDYWWEIWIDPNGREIKGEELKLLRKRGGPFPAVSPGQKQWQLKFRGYIHEDVLTQTVSTDAAGDAQLEFVPERDGYYRISWQSSQGVDQKRDRFLPPIKAETTVFVATNATTELGYRFDGVQIVVDKDTFQVGQTAPVMISVPESDKYVLFSVEADDLYSYRLVHVTGTTKLIELPIEARFVPNIYLSAALISDTKLSVDQKQVVVPPVQQFLSVGVKSDRQQYQPREEGTLTISARDLDDKPVAAEIALGLIDESVKYIQQDYAGDPRQFYYGNKRWQVVQTQSTFNQKTFARLQQVGQELKDINLAEVNEEFRVARGAGEVDREVLSLTEVAPGAAFDMVTVNAPAASGRGDFMTMMPGEMRPSGTLQPPPLLEQAVQVRNDFRSTILWLPDVRTDADGTATVKVKYPDSLTTWTATARAATVGNQFGIGNSETRTKQPLIVRLEAPRFFVVGDQVIVSAVINNNTDEVMRVNSKLIAEGLTVSGLRFDGRPAKSDQGTVEVKPGSESRVDWLVLVTHASDAKLQVEARSEKYADAMEKSFTIYEHGIEKFISRSGKMRGDSVAVHLNIPKERRTDSTSLTIQVSPSMATTMLDALPYLIDYPYGCTEQTMSRFLPAVITAKTLRDLGLRPETAMDRIFGGIEPTSASATHPKGKHNLSELDAMTKQGLERLYSFQHADGGWGWWKGGSSDHFMTAYVVWGMTLARQAGINITNEVLSRAVEYLDKELVEDELNFDAQAWMIHSLATYHHLRNESAISHSQNVAFDNLWKNRDKLNAYTRALLALTAHSYGYEDKAKILVENLENGVKIESRPDTSVVQTGAQTSDSSAISTAHWGEDGLYWRWSDGGVEATAFALRALLAIDPGNKLIEPVTNWLVKNRRGGQWSNTRDTAIVVLALNDYLRVTGEAQPNLGYELLVNGSSVAKKQISADEALSAPGTFQISRELLRDGDNEIIIRRRAGIGPLYFSAQSKFFSLEEPLSAAGNEIFVRRQYFKLVNHPTLLKGIVSERMPLNDGETVKSGERVEVVLTIEAKNNYEYLMFEDLKPAGLEAVNVRSGENLYIRELKSGAPSGKPTFYGTATDFTGRERWVYQELRDRKVAMFIDHLPQGIWQMKYEMRAESPGSFHALPVLGQAMYVPEIRTNGSEIKMRVID